MVFDLNDVEKKKAEALFAQHEKNIDYLLYLQGKIWQKSCKTPSNQDFQDPYQKRDFLFNSL